MADNWRNIEFGGYRATPLNDYDHNCRYYPEPENDFNFPYAGCGLTLGNVSSFTGSYTYIFEPAEFSVINSGHGFHASTTVQITPGFPCEAYLGYDINKLTLEVPRIPYLQDIKSSHGDNIAIKLSTSILLEAESKHNGHAIAIELKAFPTVFFDPKSEHGSEIKVSPLQSNPTVSVHIQTGSLVTPSLQATPHFQPDSAHGFASNKPELTNQTLKPVELPKSKTELGEYTEASTLVLSHVALRHIRAYDGSETKVDDLKIPRDIPLGEARSYIGYDVAKFDTRWTFILYEAASHTGSETKAGDWILDKSDWIYTQVGSQTNFVDIRTEAVYKASTSLGIQADAALSVPPAIPLQIESPLGEQANVSLHALRSPLFYPYPSVFGAWNDVSFDYETTHFDLCKCCKDIHTYGEVFNIELAHYEDQRWRCSTDIETKVTVSLLTAPRYGQTDSQFGEQIFVDLYDPIKFEPESYAGDQIRLNDFYQDLNIRLTFGNLIPDIHRADIELDAPNPDHDTTIRSLTGEQVRWDLERHTQFETEQCFGETSQAVLTIDSFAPRTGFGHHIGVALSTTVQFKSASYTGEIVEPDLYRPPLMSYMGEQVSVAISIKYEVEFLEEGCLDNEYVYANENGDEDKSKYEIQAVEKKMFRHDLKGRCY